MSLFQSFLTSIADRGREILEASNKRSSSREMSTLCDELLGEKGEALGTALARDVVETYEKFGPSEKLAFFEMLKVGFGVDHERLALTIADYEKTPSNETVRAISRAAEAKRQQLIRRVNMAPGGTMALVRMREDLIQELPTHPDYRPIDHDFVHLLASWFNRGFLELRRIDWQSPASLLEKLIRYEAVHAISGWSDLRRRLAEDRRCFGFFHPALPAEPLIFVEVALVRGLSSSVNSLISDAPEDGAGINRADTAVFYSINNCQVGLRGISFGNFLIKQVVSDLRRDFPNLKQYATLSPIPGFRRWLQEVLESEGENEGLNMADLEATKVLKQVDWWEDEAACETVKPHLLRLCAFYLLKVAGDGKPRDPVARFHLENGARLERINWRADCSEKGIRESASMMVNYVYDLGKIESQHEAYVNKGRIARSRAVKNLLD